MTTVVRYEPKGVSKPAIYTFLGLATLPRFRGRARRARDGPRTMIGGGTLGGVM